MSPLELVDDRFEKLAEELRATRPVAPEALREEVRAFEPRTRRSFRFELPWRRLVPAVAIAGLAAAVGVAGVVGIIHGASTHSRFSAQKATTPHPPVERALQHGAIQRKAVVPSFSTTLSDGVTPTAGRLQRYDASLRVRVANQEELSRRTRDALRVARKLGGYVAWANYSTPANRGDSEQLFQIPIAHVQAAIATFTGYGTLIAQRIRLKDLQQRVDKLSIRIQRLRERITRLHDPRDEARLAQLLRARSSTVRQGQMASVALALVVGKAKKAAAAPPSRFHRTLDDAGSVLLRELEILLYALVVAGPLLAIGGAGILASRSVRRRSDERLLERS